MKDGGYVVPEAFLVSALKVQVGDSIYRRFRRQETWEDKLARAIEQRSIRYRVRAFRADWSGRLHLAAEALRGEHYCEDDN